MDSALKFVGILKVLSAHGVDYILVGVLGLPSIILSKEQANREKDRATLPILRRTLLMKQQGRTGEG